MKNNNFISLLLAIALGILIGIYLNDNKNMQFAFVSKSPTELKIERLIDYIQNDYVDNVNTDNLLDGAIRQMLSKLDPHSVYISKEKLKSVTENMQGNFVGIGIQFRMVSDSVTVVHPIKGGPSIKAGIKAGDRILLSNNDTLYGKNLTSEQITKFLKGKLDTKIRLQIYRKTNDSLFSISVGRGKIPIVSVDVAYMLDETTGYIKLNRFAKSTYDEFRVALKKLIKKGMTHFILDLRGNGGGFVDVANEIADEFLSKGKLIVFTKNKQGEIYKSFANKTGDFENGKLYVLIDEDTASASEIVTGALQDNDRGTIIGRRSFGKGLVQEEKKLGDGSAVRLTIARYYTPTGRSIQKPYDHKGSKAYYLDFERRLKNGELFYRDSIKVIDSLKFKTPKGKIVYGGGGIIPDVFVPIDTTSYLPDKYFGTIGNFAFTYVDKHRKELAKWTVKNFIKNFDNDNTVYRQYISNFEGTSPSKATKVKLKKYLKIGIAYNLFGNKGLYRVKESEDKMIQKVFELENISK